MTRQEPLKQWMARARQERHPQPDVARAVLRRLHAAEHRRPLPGLSWAWPAAAACAAALCAVLGLTAWNTLGDPLCTWLGELATWGMI